MLHLTELGNRIQQVDRMIIDLVVKRMELARLVGAYKEVNNDPVYRAEIEDGRLEHIAEYASNQGVNRHFAEALLYLLIDESCKTQLIQLQGGTSAGLLPVEPNERYRVMKQNLIRLTEVVASAYDAASDGSYPATQLYVEFEDSLILSQAKQANGDSTALDLGCATGRIAGILAPHFQHVVGVDISQHMIAEAVAKKQHGNVLFEQADLEEGIPAKDNSVSFVSMNLGTTSDLDDAKSVVKEIERVLEPGGRYLLSFYNADALVNQVPFRPYEVGLEAVIDPDEHCLTLTAAGETFKVHAKPYKWEDIELLMPSTLKFESMQSYPTLASIVPKTLLMNTEVRNSIVTVDKSLLSGCQGAYTVIYGRKT